MLAAILVAVVVDSHVIDGSRPATLEAGVVVAPLDPYVRRFADRIEATANDGTITVGRGDANVSLTIGSPIMRIGTSVETLPIAPFVRGGEPNIPLAATARALGASVSYDPRAHVVYIRLGHVPIARMTPIAGYVPPTSPVTFSPTSTPAPRVVVTGVPHPRRTPILVQSEQ